MDEERAEYLVERYADLLVRIGYTWLGDLDDAKDICQTVLIKLLEDPRQFPDRGQERAWVVRLGMNACKNWRKSAWLRHRADLDEGLCVSAEDPEPEEGGLLEQVMALPPKYRAAVYLHYYEGYTAPQIGQLLGKNVNTVYTLLTRSKGMLREKLGGEGDG